MERSAAAIGLTKPAHHQGIARGRECVVVLLYQQAIFSVVQAIFFEPAVILALEYFPASAAPMPDVRRARLQIADSKAASHAENRRLCLVAPNDAVRTPRKIYTVRAAEPERKG